MVEEFRYEDKRVGIDENDKGSLKNLVNEEFKKIDRYGYRDDQEIRNAGWNIINKLITEIKQDKNMVYGSWAMDPLIQLSKKLKEEYNNMNGRKLITNNEDKINQVAQRIDNAENETLKRLAKNRTTQDSRDIVRRSNEVYKKNPMFVMEGGNDSSKQTGNIIFTKESNPVKIHEALNGLFKNPNVVYEIDYSGCTNQRIKDKMVGLIGTQTCYLKYDSSQNTYTIRDSQGNGISQRAYIWEGVKLIPAGVKQRHAYSEQKTQNEKLGKVDNSQIDSLTGAMLKDIPSAKRLTEEEQKNLVKKTEDRITELLRRAKKLGYELEPECVTKKWLGKGHVELHLNSGSSEVNWTVWGNNGSYNEILGEKLDDFIDSNEGEYVRYLMKRVVSKWQELDSLTKIETTNVEIEGGQNLTKEEREQAKLHRDQVLYGISLFEKMVDNYRESEGDSRLDNDDRKLLQIKQLIRNVKASITNSNAIDDGVLTLNFVDPIREKWAAIKGISKTVSGGYGQVYDNSSYKQQYDQLKKVFFGSYNEQIRSIRDLGGFGRMFDKTETSFLQQEIENNGFNEGGQKLEVKYTNVNECIQKIYNFKVDLSQEAGDFDESGNLSSSGQEKVKELDDLYEKSKLEKSEFANYLSSLGLLPQNWKIENEMVLKAVESLQNRLTSTQKLLDNFSKTKESLVEGQHMKKLKLEQKENKTEEDLKELQALEYLEQNIEERDKIIEVTLNMMKVDLKYGGINQLLGSCLFESLIKLGGGAIGTNADIYNDIIGYGVFDLSDENAKIAGDFVGDILEEVVILAVAIAIGTVTAGAGTALIMGARATRLGAKGVKYGKYIYELANKVTKPIGKIIKRTGNFVKTSKTGQKIAKATESIKHTKLGKNLNKIRLEQNTAKLTASQGNRAEILRLWRKENKTLGDMYKLGSLVNKEGRMGTKMLAAIFEGTGFHLSSTAIHNAINGVDLSTGLNPFGYTEGPNGEKFSNFKGYVQSIAFLGILKFVGQPIQNLTQASLKTVLGEKISANAFGKILQQIGSITGEFGSLTVTDETINVIFEGNLKELTVEDAIHSLGMILGLRAYGKIKQIANLKIKGYNRNKKELNAEIDGNDNVVTEDMLDRIRQQQELQRNREELQKKKESKEKRKSDLEKKKSELERKKDELLRQRKQNRRSLDGQKNGVVEPLKRLKNKINNKKAEIKALEEEIARLEKGKNTVAYNDYFEIHKQEFVNKQIELWIDGVKYKVSPRLNDNGDIQFREVGGNKKFTISSFKQLGKRVLGYNPYGKGYPTEKELSNHDFIKDAIKKEGEYLDSRDVQETINQKKSDLQKAEGELRYLEDKLPASQARQNAIDARAKKGTEINKELGKLKSELDGVNRELGETDRLIKKYQDQIDGIESELQLGEEKDQERKEQERKEQERKKQERRQREEQQRRQREEQQRRQRKEQQRRQREEEQKRQREEKLSNEVTNEIKNKIPDLLKREQRSSISSEFSNNPELHQNFIKTKVLKNLINYVENITKSGKNPDLIEVLKGSKEELNNISYEQRIELINNINSYLKSVETASRFINIEKSGGVSAKELFLRAKGLDTSEINNFEGNVTIEQFRNSIVFVFEKASDVQRFFGQNGNGNHFENKIPGLDTIVINKENCKNAEKIGLKEGDAISRVLQHESQHAINEIFMPKDVKITYEEAMDPVLTDINTVKKYALDRAKDEIIAQYTNRLIIKNLSTETISILSKGGGIKELLTTEGNTYDYFKKRRNTPEEKKAREEYKREVEKMCDYVDETIKSCKSNEEIQNMLNMFCTTDVKERKNIKDIVKSKEEQQQKTQQRRQTKEQKRTQEKNEIEDVQFTEEEINTLNEMLDKYKNTKSDDIPLADRQKVLNIIKNKYDIKETEKKANELKNYIEDFFESDLSNKIDVIDFGDYETTKNLAGRLTKFLEKKYGLPELNVILHNQEAGRFGVSNKNEIHLNINSRNGSNNRDILDFFINIYSHEFCHTLDAYGKGSLNPQINELGFKFYIKSGDYYYNNPVEITAHRTGEIVSGKKGYGFDDSGVIGERFSEKIKKSLAEEIDKIGTEESTNPQEQHKRQQEQQRKQQVEQESRQIENKDTKSQKPERGINTERREMQEVKRNSDVVAIGDLHGEYVALKGNMEYAGLAREINGHLEWTGGNKKVVFQGDILGDRGTDGLRIIKEIHQLREQARQQGGDIDIIVGNHDDFMIAYLLGGKVSRFARPGEEASGLDIAMNRSQGQGLTELLDFIGINRTGEFDDFLNLGGKDKNKKILEAMKKSSEGRLILEEICNMKLVTQIDDVLYIHTNPTARMLQYLTRGNIQSNINSLNQKYQGYLKEKLLGEGNGNISIDEFNNISDIFLNTGNRNISGIENYVEQLKNSGINMISHGHSGGSPYRSTEIGGVKIVDTDYGYGKFGELDHEHSISIVKKENGSIESGEGYNKYIGKTIDFHLGDRKQYRGTIESIQGVGKYQRVTIKYIDPQYGEQTINSKLSDINNWGGFKIAE